jgi:Zn-dependent M28 family amino/carboxypeptidase
MAEEGKSAASLRMIVRNTEAIQWYGSLQPGQTRAVLRMRLPEPKETRVKLRNVIGLLRGSDPALKDTYILLTAHYDHLGMRSEGADDRIFNGANDDGSGTVSVIELASALATLKPRPKRSIVFMTFFGEEEGTLGSRYYADHPVFPIEKTVADVNLEQVGRTDAIDGAKVSQGTFTGGDYSDLPSVFRKAGARTGVRVLSDKQNGGSFFARSDNLPFAEKGIPAHTLAVAFEFADYHQTGDKWQKIDYENMAKVDRMVALGLTMLADNPRAPHWDESVSQTERYIEAWRERHR